MGIAWETENVYWVYDGLNATIARYDFGEDHGVGYDDHSDGIIGKVTDLTLSRLEDVPSHMEVDQASGMLYAVDTGANRVLILDTQTGEKGRRLSTTEPGTDHHELDNVEYSVFIDGSTVDGMSAPSGLDLIDGHLLVTDFETGRILAFDMTGELVDWVDSGRAGGIMGIEARSLDDIWFVDAAADELVRLQP
jgi:DNA-binding beta-propeller fold protein YncE